MTEKNLCVLPALPEVGKPVSECDFEEFKEKGIEHAELEVADDNHFEGPTDNMCKKKNIYTRDNIVERVDFVV